MSSKSVILCLGRGDLANGCPDVSIELLDSDNRSLMKKFCQLPSDIELLEIYRRWQVWYKDYYELRGWYSRSLIESDDEGPDEFTATGITNFSECSGEELGKLSEVLVDRFNKWLAKSFNDIEKKLRSRLSLAEKFIVVVETESE